jgi:hypothetical protein
MWSDCSPSLHGLAAYTEVGPVTNLREDRGKIGPTPLLGSQIVMHKDDREIAQYVTDEKGIKIVSWQPTLSEAGETESQKEKTEKDSFPYH